MSDSHPCMAIGCQETVQYDDEPYCYRHSPDSGSYMKGFSYKKTLAAKLGVRSARTYLAQRARNNS